MNILIMFKNSDFLDKQRLFLALLRDFIVRDKRNSLL